MRARRERAVAPELALKLEKAAEDSGLEIVRIWAVRVVEFTEPRPWWRFW